MNGKANEAQQKHRNMAGKIVVVGSTNTDMVVKAARLPQPGETIIGGKFFMFPGGKGANQAVAAARLGGQVTLVANTGNDVFGKQSVSGFKQEGIDTTYIGRDAENPSGVALIGIDAKGENSILVAPGANMALSEADVDSAAEAIQAADVVLVQLEIPLPTVLHVVKRCAEWGRKLIVNPAPAHPLNEAFYKGLFAITPNETETELLTGTRVTDEVSARRAADVLLSRGVQHVIITMGSQGAYLHNADQSVLLPAPTVEAVDTTAAGDVFNGALAVGIADGLPIEQAISVACRAAAISVTRMGAQASAPYQNEM
jgi:ribokinase